MKKIDPKEWQFYLTRPFDLFGASLWHGWYESKYIQHALGFKMDEIICVEISPHLVSQYRAKEQMRLLTKHIQKLIFLTPKKFERLLKHGLALSKKADRYLEKPHKFKNLDDALEFFNELIFYTTVFSNFPTFLDQNKKLPNKAIGMISQLRSASYYSPFLKKIIMPLAKAHPLVILQKKNHSKRFIYTKRRGKEEIQWVKNTKNFVKQFETHVIKSKEIKGFAAYPGKVRGRVHLVRDFTKPGKMKDGSILVSINTNPNLMPLIRKASAIVSDEGGITSHAAIVSREFKIPCVIGTKVATKVLKNNDLVEVDANKGIVRKLK